MRGVVEVGCQHRDFLEDRERAVAATLDVQEQPEPARADLDLVDVRAGLVAQQRVDVVGGPRAHAAVQVEGHHQREVGSDLLPHRGTQIRLRAVERVGRRGAVEGQQHTVDVACRRNPRQYLVLQVGPGLVGERAAGERLRGQCGDEGDAFRLGGLDHAAHLGEPPAVQVEHSLAQLEVDLPAVLQRRPQRGEDCHFVVEVPYHDTHGDHPTRSCRVVASASAYGCARGAARSVAVPALRRRRRCSSGSNPAGRPKGRGQSRRFRRAAPRR